MPTPKRPRSASTNDGAGPGMQHIVYPAKPCTTWTSRLSHWQIRADWAFAFRRECVRDGVIRRRLVYGRQRTTMNSARRGVGHPPRGAGSPFHGVTESLPGDGGSLPGVDDPLCLAVRSLLGASDSLRGAHGRLRNADRPRGMPEGYLVAFAAPWSVSALAVPATTEENSVKKAWPGNAALLCCYETLSVVDGVASSQPEIQRSVAYGGLYSRI